MCSPRNPPPRTLTQEPYPQKNFHKKSLITLPPKKKFSNKNFLCYIPCMGILSKLLKMRKARSYKPDQAALEDMIEQLRALYETERYQLPAPPTGTGLYPAVRQDRDNMIDLMREPFKEPRIGKRKQADYTPGPTRQNPVPFKDIPVQSSLFWDLLKEDPLSRTSRNVLDTFSELEGLPLRTGGYDNAEAMLMKQLYQAKDKTGAVVGTNSSPAFRKFLTEEGSQKYLRWMRDNGLPPHTPSRYQHELPPKK